MSNNDFSLSKYQYELKRVLSRIVGVLNKNKIPYFALFGTCLGAVRHGDIIPWDDDVDIGVRREYYDKVKECIMRECPDLYFWDWFVDSGCCLSFGRIFRRIEPDDTIEMRRAYIDMYIIDNIPNSKILRFMYKLSKTVVARHLIRRCKAKIQYKTFTVVSSIIYCLGIPLYLFTTKGLCSAHRWISKMYGNKTTLYAAIGGAVISNSFLKKSRVAYLGDVKISIPNEAEKYLESVYGDWRSLPPEGQRGEHAFKANGDIIAAMPADSLRR